MLCLEARTIFRLCGLLNECTPLAEGTSGFSLIVSTRQWVHYLELAGGKNASIWTRISACNRPFPSAVTSESGHVTRRFEWCQDCAAPACLSDYAPFHSPRTALPSLIWPRPFPFASNCAAPTCLTTPLSIRLELHCPHLSDHTPFHTPGTALSSPVWPRTFPFA